MAQTFRFLADDAAFAALSYDQLQAPWPVAFFKDISTPVKLFRVRKNSKDEWKTFEDLGWNEFVMECSVEENLDKDGEARLSMVDPTGELIDNELLSEGSLVEIQLGFLGDIGFFGEWVINEINPRLPAQGFLTLEIVCNTILRKMMTSEDSERWENVKASTIASIIALRNGLTPVVDDTEEILPEFSRASESELSSLIKLSESYGFDLFVRNGELHFHNRKDDRIPFKLTYRDLDPRKCTLKQLSISRVRYQQDGVKNKGKSVASFDGIIVSSSSPAQKDEIEAAQEATAKNAGATQLTQEEMYGDTNQASGKAVPTRTAPLAIPTSFDSKKAKSSAIKAKVKEKKGVELSGETAYGITALRIGKTVEIEGVSQKYSGLYQLTSVSHTVGKNGYETSFDCVTLFRNRGIKSPSSGVITSDQRKNEIANRLVGKELNLQSGKAGVTYKVGKYAGNLREDQLAELARVGGVDIGDLTEASQAIAEAEVPAA